MDTHQIVTQEPKPRCYTQPRVVEVCCRKPGCKHSAVATTEGSAIRSISAHIVAVHGPQLVRRVTTNDTIAADLQASLAARSGAR